MRDLCPEIIRQRLIIEWIIDYDISVDQIKEYLIRIGAITQMVVLTEPVTHRSDKYWRSGWIHWETSWAHFYAWEQPKKFFSVDMYTCKQFEIEPVIKFTQEYFKTIDLDFKEV